jgi:asparagine synthase (glutamine-hydrolysing)
MSGIFGLVDFCCGTESGETVVAAMAQALRHRGLDGKGVWACADAALGHRRGASADESQPAIREIDDATVALTYDGAIYNRDELRAMVSPGEETRTATDAELLLRAYLARGADFVCRLNGAFALAIWDGRNRRLVMARDRIGIKPLYYFKHPGGLVFASEPKGIMAHPRFEPRLDLSAISILLQPRLTRPGETPLVGLHEVPPAHIVSYSSAGMISRRFWQLTSAPHRASFAQTADRVRLLLEDSVGRRVPATGQCAAMLSGGIDSTSVAALAARKLSNGDKARSLDTFCLRFDGDQAHFVPSELRPGVDEPYAAIAAEFIGSRHSTVTVDFRDLIEAIPATREARDLPGWGQFDASMYLLFRQMRGAAAVGLSGEAADELFGGYPYLLKPQLVNRSTFPWLGEGPKLSSFLSAEMRTLIDPEEDERARYAQALSEVPALPGEDPTDARMREVLFLGMLGPLTVLLDREERMSMSQGFDVRLPFCDHRLIEYVWNVPWKMKCQGGLKGLLKAAVGDLLPQATVTRTKSAYPHIQDPEYDQTLLSEARRAINEKNSPVGWMFNAPRFNRLLDMIGANEPFPSLPGGTSGSRLLIQLVELRRWIEDSQVTVR